MIWNKSISGKSVADPLPETYGLRNVFARFQNFRRMNMILMSRGSHFPGGGCDLAGAVRRSYLGGTGKCFDGRRLWEQPEPSAKPFRDSYRGEPPNSRGMDVPEIVAWGEVYGIPLFRKNLTPSVSSTTGDVCDAPWSSAPPGNALFSTVAARGAALP